MSQNKNIKFLHLFASFSRVFEKLLIGPSSVSLASSVITEVISDMLKGKFGLSDKEQKDIRERAKKASEHLVEASKILNVLQDELNDRNKELESLLVNIDEKKAEAEHWKSIVSADKEKSKALFREIESRLSQRLRHELDRNKTRRRIVSTIMWVLTLIAGGIAGALIQNNLFQ